MLSFEATNDIQWLIYSSANEPAKWTNRSNDIQMIVFWTITARVIIVSITWP